MTRKAASAEDVRVAQARADQSPSDVDARVALVATLASWLFDQGEPLTPERFGPHLLFLVESAPALWVMPTRGLVLPGSEWHLRLDRAWAEAVARDPDNLEVLRNAAQFHWGGDDDRVRAALGRAFALAPDDEWIRARWGELQLRGADMGRADCSIAAAADLLDPGCKFPPSMELAAIARAANGELARAEELAERTLELAEPGVVDYAHLANTVLGLCRSETGAREAAVEYLQLSAANPLGWRGPSFRLAARLLADGERGAVADFLRAMLMAWPAGHLQVASWLEALAGGGRPVLLNPGR